MNRLASVVSHNDHTVNLKLLKAENCAGCPVNCNEPLIDIFSMRKNQFSLTANDPRYRLVDTDGLMQLSLPKDSLIQLKIDANDLIKSSGLLYLIPLFAGLLGLVLGHYIAQVFYLSLDLFSLLGFFIGVLSFVAYIKYKINFKHLKFRPEVTIFKVDGT